MRLAEGMRHALEETAKSPVTKDSIQWRTLPVTLPPAVHLDEAKLRADLTSNATPTAATLVADKLAWLLRCRQGHKIELAMLTLGDIRVLHMPGELFVEYQLAAQEMRADCHVAMAAYGDYGPGYIGTARAYDEGGYETSQGASNVAPAVEDVLMVGMRKLLGGESKRPGRSTVLGHLSRARER